jgi:hypothetical protein
MLKVDVFENQEWIRKQIVIPAANTITLKNQAFGFSLPGADHSIYFAWNKIVELQFYPGEAEGPVAVALNEAAKTILEKKGEKTGEVINV